MRKIKVIDRIDMQPLEGANLIFLDIDQKPLPGGGVVAGPDGITTDAAGEAYLPENPLIKFVKISFVGYGDRVVAAESATISLNSKSFEFGTATVSSCRQFNNKNENGECVFSWIDFLKEHKLVVVFVIFIIAFIAFLLSHKF